MPIQVTCPGCHARFKVSDQHAGKKGPCPKCKGEIQVPRKEDEVVIQAPEQFGGARDAAGNLVLKPIERKETTLTLWMSTAIFGGIFAVFALAVVLRGYHPDGEVPLFLRALGAIALAPLLAYVGYAFLRDAELEPYRGVSLLLRISICAVVYALLWGGYTLAVQYFEIPVEAWSLVFLIPPFVFLGALAAFASLDLNPTSAFLHYAFYLTVTVVLRLTVGLTAF